MEELQQNELDLISGGIVENPENKLNTWGNPIPKNPWEPLLLNQFGQ